MSNFSNVYGGMGKESQFNQIDKVHVIIVICLETDGVSILTDKPKTYINYCY